MREQSRVRSLRNLCFCSLGMAALIIAGTQAVQSGPEPSQSKKIEAPVTAQSSPEGLQRKLRSERILASEGVPINRSLPYIETEAEITPRTKEEVVQRALALLVVAVKGEGLDQPSVKELIEQRGLAAYFTPKEIAFIQNEAPSDDERLEFDARYEAAWTLLWALGYVDALRKPTDLCDAAVAMRFMTRKTSAEFLAGAKLRPLSEILDQADLIYRYDWAVVDGRVNGKIQPTDLNEVVTQQRHYALNWLIRYLDEEWDEISTDT